MPFKITYEPLNRTRDAQPTTVSKDTAAEAWKTVDGLMRSDERVSVEQVPGGSIHWQELKRLAEEETGNA